MHNCSTFPLNAQPYIKDTLLHCFSSRTQECCSKLRPSCRKGRECMRRPTVAQSHSSSTMIVPFSRTLQLQGKTTACMDWPASKHDCLQPGRRAGSVSMYSPTKKSQAVSLYPSGCQPTVWVSSSLPSTQTLHDDLPLPWLRPSVHNTACSTVCDEIVCHMSLPLPCALPEF